MQKYRAREVIEAVQWFPEKPHPDVEYPAYKGTWQEEYSIRAHGPCGVLRRAYTESDGDYAGKVTQSALIVRPGDWIIDGGESDWWPLHPDIFEATYEPVTSEEGE